MLDLTLGISGSGKLHSAELGIKKACKTSEGNWVKAPKGTGNVVWSSVPTKVPYILAKPEGTLLGKKRLTTHDVVNPATESG